VLLLHGAGARAEDILRTFRQIADKYGVLLAVPSSRRQSWDIVLGQYGEDVARIDKTLSRVLDRYAVDPARVAIAGFSDGASYALSLGILNGALFTHVLAFSPGFTPSSKAAARPQIFIAHGIKDSVLPIDQTSRKIVARLRHNGFEPVYREFPDGHVVPPDLADEAFAWVCPRENQCRSAARAASRVRTNFSQAISARKILQISSYCSSAESGTSGCVLKKQGDELSGSKHRLTR
jgi:phospholipase/carboxylesterase